MKRSLLSTMLCAMLSSACGAGTAPTTPEPGMNSAQWNGDPRLYAILLPYPLTSAMQDSLRAYSADHPEAMSELLAEAILDETAPASVRVNALSLLAQRRPAEHFHVFRAALDANDVRVRASAVAVLRDFMASHPLEATRIARTALSDSAPEVQAQALQVLGDADVELLRRYVNTAANEDLRAIAVDLVRLAEQRGAPLEGDSVTGVLQRTTASGARITFTPRTYWPQWNAAVGSVSIARASGAPLVLEDIEVAGGVVPAFLSTDGGRIVFERDRRIVVRDMTSGGERVVGTGIAPRPRPFTEEFVFMRERPDSAEEQREVTRLHYDVYSAPFDGSSEPRLIGSTVASVTFARNGAYSPVRWMRVEERGGSFYLTSTDMEIVTLPDPFG